MKTNTDGAETTNLLEMQRRVVGIRLEKLIIIVREVTHFGRQIFVALPKPSAGEVFHRSLQRPSRRSLSASSAKASRRPAAMSRSIWRSHTAASNCANHSLNFANSSGG